MTGAYSRWSGLVVAEVQAFRRDHENRHYARIAELCAQLPDTDATGREQEYVFSGWAGRQSPLDRGLLHRLNPGYRIRVRREFRVNTGRLGRVLPLGYRVTLRGGLDLPSPVFRTRGPVRPAWSNTDAEFAHRRIEPGSGSAPTEEVPSGYLDGIIHAPAPDDDRPATWLASFVHHHPSEAHDFAVSEWGAPFRGRFAALTRRFDAGDRWGDRFALTAHGLAETPRSDLALLAVSRPHPPRVASALATGVPVLERSGQLVRVVGEGRPMPVPDEAWTTVRNALLQDAGTVTTDHEFIRYEAAADPTLDFVSGQWRTTFGSAARPDGVLLRRMPEAAETIPEGILIGGRSDSNWFHWIAEYLPRVLTIPPTIDADVPLIVSPYVPATGLEALAELSSRPTVVADPASTTRVGILHVASPPIQVLDTTRIAWSDGVSLNRAGLERLRKAWGVETPRDTDALRLFIERRAAHRGIDNESALRAIAVRHGFESVDPSAMTFAEQRDLFSRAAVLVGASGAVMANYLMLRPGARILALTSEHLADFVLPAVLARVADAEFRYLLGKSAVALDEAEDRNRWIHADFSIRPRDLDQALEFYD